MYVTKCRKLKHHKSDWLMLSDIENNIIIMAHPLKFRYTCIRENEILYEWLYNDTVCLE